MKTDTLTGPNLSHWAAVVYGCTDIEFAEMNETVICIFHDETMPRIFDYADPATFQPIAEREKIGCIYLPAYGKWQARTTSKNCGNNGRYSKNIFALGDTEAEARMRCYVKSYLGEDTKE